MDVSNDDYSDFESRIFTRMGYRIYGICLCSFCIISSIAYFIILITKPEFKNNTAYRLIFHLGIADFINIIDSIVARFVEIFPKKFNPGKQFGKAYGAYDEASLIPANFMTLALAIQRLQAINNFHCLSRIKESTLGHILAFSAYLAWVLTYVMLVITPSESLEYIDIDNLILDLTGRTGNAKGITGGFLESLVFYLQIGTVVVALILYIWCAISIVQKRQIGGGPIMTTQERRIFIQTMIPCAIKLFCQSQWFYYVSWNMYGAMLQNFFLTFDSLYLPYFYFLANKTMRKYVLGIFGVKQEQTSSFVINTSLIKRNSIANPVVNR